MSYHPFCPYNVVSCHRCYFSITANLFMPAIKWVQSIHSWYAWCHKIAEYLLMPLRLYNLSNLSCLIDLKVIVFGLTQLRGFFYHSCAYNLNLLLCSFEAILNFIYATFCPILLKIMLTNTI